MLSNLKAEMARRSVSSSNVGEIAGVSDRTVRSWVRGESQPTVGQALTIIDELFPDCSASYLFEGAKRS